ncbi:hypothetical protein FZEAL_1297 [Fusarium zealandicum]|uniref:Uncharacterized protein n=1 Tax=Fusarium zealandicum TaxID=1053134 RepID=A0A8H4UTI9_9HYPO|nr:hypothetical protein FZEAL_1297 [Fusarium zealandicum]
MCISVAYVYSCGHRVAQRQIDCAYEEWSNSYGCCSCFFTAPDAKTCVKTYTEYEKQTRCEACREDGIGLPVPSTPQQYGDGRQRGTGQGSRQPAPAPVAPPYSPAQDGQYEPEHMFMPAPPYQSSPPPVQFLTNTHPQMPTSPEPTYHAGYSSRDRSLPVLRSQPSQMPSRTTQVSERDPQPAYEMTEIQAPSQPQRQDEASSRPQNVIPRRPVGAPPRRQQPQNVIPRRPVGAPPQQRRPRQHRQDVPRSVPDNTGDIAMAIPEHATPPRTRAVSPQPRRQRPIRSNPAWMAPDYEVTSDVQAYLNNEDLEVENILAGPDEDYREFLGPNNEARG